MSRAALLAALLLPLAATAPATAGAKVVAHGSVEQVDVTGAKPGSLLRLLDRRERTVGTQRAGRLGAALFRDVKPGSGYRLKVGHAGPLEQVTVLSRRSAPPDTKLYRSQKLPAPGYGYLTTRDGTQLAINVQLPGPKAKGPYPTLVEYSGYGYANPAGGESSIAQVATLLGYAVVDVNMRGTGCSGGAFDYFEPLQGLDGYDVIETVARQPWVLNHKPGMLGISYGGISQLFVAATAPPSLAAITPLSVIDNTATTLYPGGLLNTGFALSWAKDRVHDAKPASATGGQAWALKRIQGGDKTCKANQALHAEAVDLLAKSRANFYYNAKVADPLAPATFVQKIKVPTFLACQLTDEQTGGHCPDLASRFTGTAHKWFTFTNGTHIDSLDPTTFNRWYDFLELYVARRAPNLPAALKNLAPVVFQTTTGIKGITLPDDPLQGLPSYGEALAAFEAQLPVRVLFDNGAGGSAPGVPLPGFEQSFPSWPLPGTTATAFYLGGGGALTDAPPAAATADQFTYNKAARPVTSFSGNTGPGGLWGATPQYRWVPNPAGTAVSYVTAPLGADTVVVGPGALDAWIKSSVPALDLQVTVSEVRPDGQETFVQNGWLRGTGRKLDAKKSTPLEPVPSLTKSDDAPLPTDRYAEVQVPLYHQAHAYRAGSRIKVTIAAPSGDQPIWAFGTSLPKGTATVAVAATPAMPSHLLLPVVPGIAVPTPLPPCPGLRGEPCRPYEAPANTTATP
jgi:uncharacterized protein